MINFDIDSVRNRIQDIWLKNNNIPQDKMAKDIGLSPHAFRRILNGKCIRLRMMTKMKLIAWVNKMEAICKTVNVN